MGMNSPLLQESGFNGRLKARALSSGGGLLILILGAQQMFVQVNEIHFQLAKFTIIILSLHSLETI